MKIQLPDSHGWFSLGLFLSTWAVFGAMIYDPSLRKDDLFKMLAQAIVLTGLVNLAASFYFTASKKAANAASQGDGGQSQ